MPQVGDPAPDFTLPSTLGPIRLQDYRGRKVVLLFFAEALTPACSLQVSSFKDEYATVQGTGAEVIAISADPLPIQERFGQALGGCPFPLASDPDLQVARAYGVVSADGRRAQRAVFVIDAEGRIVEAIPWFQPGNVAQFLQVFQALGAV
ncbi:MAG: peroxiredoxin [Dehalococcoidia bacterium]|nr:peroxiredoxin [Dehalococcoidia bacterium]MDW8119728.1 peroxiredoxin [Chloroflexota bacterium]